MEGRANFLQIMLQVSICTFSSGLQFVAIAVKIKIKILNILNFITFFILL
jgi:hypothetical protein